MSVLWWALLACGPVQPVDPVTEAVAADRALLDAALEELPPTQDGGPSVVIIVLDTLRADHLGAYGDDRGLMPTLDAFASEGRVYSEMQSVAPWTLPSHASLFTGVWPIHHGAHGAPPDSKAKALGLGKQLPTLAERMQEAGYTTVGVAANKAFLDKRWGLSRGFQLWLCTELTSAGNISYTQGNRISALGGAVAQARGQGKLLLFLNYMEAHSPWVAREGYVQDPSRLHREYMSKAGSLRGRRYEFGDYSHGVNAGRYPASPEALETWEEVYAAELRYLDDQLAALFTELEAGGHDFEQDYTIILSDHGEFLGEMDRVEHSKGLYEIGVRVPLIVRGPGIQAGVDPTPIQTAQVPDLLLGLLGLPLLNPDSQADALLVSEQYWARSKARKRKGQRKRFDHLFRSYTLDGHKLLLRDDGPPEAYDLRADPAEEQNLYPSAPWIPELQSQADAWLSAQTVGEGTETALDAEAEEALRALGYIE
ncbi:MAG: sulfatase [Myxococcota bacterium]|nr:sulfatase [Myxococcota bacterium]